MAEAEQPDLTTLTVQLLSAYLSNNTVPSGEVAGLVQSTRTALSGDVGPAEPEQPEFVPAVTVRKSLASPDHIISLIDGKPYKSLKRHLSTRGLSPAEYRERYKLPNDYPMVAPGYSEQRRAVAQRLGLGRKKAEPQPSVETPEVDASSTEGPAPEAVQPAPSVAERPAKARTRRARAAIAPNEDLVTESAPPTDVPDAVAPAALEASVTKPKAKPRKKPAASPSEAKVSAKGKQGKQGKQAVEPKAAPQRKRRSATPTEPEAAQRVE